MSTQTSAHAVLILDDVTSALGNSVFAGSYSDSLYSVTCDVRFPHAVPPEISLQPQSNLIS